MESHSLKYWSRILGHNWDKSPKSFPPYYSQSLLLTDFTPLPSLSKCGLDLVCNVNIVYENLKSETRLCPETSIKLDVHGFSLWTPSNPPTVQYIYELSCVRCFRYTLNPVGVWLAKCEITFWHRIYIKYLRTRFTTCCSYGAECIPCCCQRKNVLLYFTGLKGLYLKSIPKLLFSGRAGHKIANYYLTQ